MSQHTEIPDRLVGLAAVGGFAGAMAVLHLLGGPLLAPPPLTSATQLSSWVADHQPTVIAMVVIRMAALGLGYHLAVTTILAVVGRAVRAPGLVAFADAITLPMFRSSAGRIAGLLISASTLAGGALPSASATTSPAAASAAVPVTGTGTGTGTGAVIERVRLSPTAPGTSAGDRAGSGRATLRPVPVAPATNAAPPAAPAPVLHRVAPGDHLWGIAERALESAWGRAVDDIEVDRFWRQVIVANPDLVDPDLIFPGQLVVVPPVPPAPV